MPSPLPALFQRLDQEQDFGSHRGVQIRRVGEGAVAAAGDDGLEGADEAAVASRFKVGSLFMEIGRGAGWVASEQGLGYVEAEPACTRVVLTPVAAVGEIAVDGLAVRICGGGGVAAF